MLRCSKYAFGPNRLHYCGPDRNAQLLAHIAEGESDPTLARMLSGFETMYPYLVHIAAANRIKDPLDDRVVEAYWIGNALLARVDKGLFYRHLVEGLRLKDKLDPYSFALVEKKVGEGAVPHHSFHVFDVWKRMGYAEREHSLENMDDCRVSWGAVTAVSGPFVSVMRSPLVREEGKIFLGNAVPVRMMRRLESDQEIEELRPGDIVTMHWRVLCERISKRQAAALRAYTLRHLALMNETL